MKYFIVYRWKYEGRDYESDWHVINTVTERHPIEELIHWNTDSRQQYTYQLLFWSEISDEVYEKAKTHINEAGEFGDQSA